MFSRTSRLLSLFVLRIFRVLHTVQFSRFWYSQSLLFLWISSAEGGIWTLAPLLTTYSLSRGAPSATWVLLLIDTLYLVVYQERREWDSNPRALADKRFSRPPRYDHFDISPNVLSYYIMLFFICQELFYFSFWNFFVSLQRKSFFEAAISGCFCCSQLPFSAATKSILSLFSTEVNCFFKVF